MATKKAEAFSPETQKILADLEKKHGLEVSGKDDIKVISTGSYTLDIATGIGGYPLGKIIEMFGPESSGKSTVCLHAIAEFQRTISNKIVALFDYEHSFDKNYAKDIGVDVDKLKIYQPDNQEQGYDMILSMVDKGIVSLVVIDSHTAAIPKSIIEGDISDATYALQARNNSKFLGKIKGPIAKSEVCLIAVSQTRANIGGMTKGDISTGGNAWKFYDDMRFKIWKQLKKEDELNRTTVDVIKNKCAPPYGSAEFDILWGEGIDTYGEILEAASEKNIVKKSGSWYAYNNDKLGQGKASIVELLKGNKELFAEIKQKVISYLPSEKVAVVEEI